MAKAQGIAVSPSRVFFEGAPGETVVQALTFSNTSNMPFTLRASIKDWQRDSLGRKVYFPAATLEHSNSNWITLSTSTVTLQPGATQEVMLTMTVPEGVPKRLTNSMVFFTQTKARQSTISETPQLGVNVLLELGVQAYHDPGALAVGELNFIAFEDFGITTAASGPVRRLGVKIKNSGELNQDAHLRFELTDMTTGEELPVSTVPIAMLPGAEQWVYIDADAGLDGRYLAVAILDAGSSYDLKVAEKELTY
ncbi:Fn3-like domain-containing protein [Parapedobacter pyrenivorans]|uniref:Fn3-like domain-containing protein n=1 Tax=Parapedobacter pyrenivorans TaxID=1305674 RepID=UPI0016641BD0|nr:Fn3-like domain-containing protein [Parapedobacter pyrenivorans]